MNVQNSISSFFTLIFCSLCFASSFFLIFEINIHLSIIWGVTLRIFFGIIFSLLYFLYIHHEIPKIKLGWTDFSEGLTLQVLPYLLVFSSELFIPPQHAGAFMALVPIWIICAGLSVKLAGTETGAHSFKQLGLTSLVLIMILALTIQPGSKSPPDLLNLFGLLLAAASTVCYAAGTLISRKNLENKSPLEKCILQHAASLIIIIPVALIVSPQGLTSSINSSNWQIILYYAAGIGLISNFMAWFFYNKLVSEHSSLFASIAIMLVPFICYLMAVGLGETTLEITSLILCFAISVLAYGIANQSITAGKRPSYEAIQKSIN